GYRHLHHDVAGIEHLVLTHELCTGGNDVPFEVGTLDLEHADEAVLRYWSCDPAFPQLELQGPSASCLQGFLRLELHGPFLWQLRALLHEMSEDRGPTHSLACFHADCVRRRNCIHACGSSHNDDAVV